MAREGTNIKYYVDGTAVRTVATTVTYQLFADVSIWTGVVPVISASFGQAPATYYAITNGTWTNPAIWSLTDGGAPGTLYPGATDTAIIKGYTVSVGTGIYCGNVM